jgi:7-cyano-7-deazaguanine reductase
MLPWDRRRERRAREVHPSRRTAGERHAQSDRRRGRGARETSFVALGQPGSERYAGLETFSNPGVSRVERTNDELVSVCPITGQPDLYVASIESWPHSRCIESTSLKLHLVQFRNEGHLCEALAVRIGDEVAQALELPAGQVRVTLRQKACDGITVTATS